MNDIDLTELAKEWQRDSRALAVSRRKALRQYWLNRLAFGFELAFGAVGLWAAWYFWRQDGTVYTVSACVLVLATALGAWASFRERLPLWHWHDWSPDGVLAYRIRRCESTLRIARSCRYSAGALLAFVAYIWIHVIVVPGSLPAFFPPFYTVFVLATVTALLSWARRQTRERARELLQLRGLLDTPDT